MNDIEKLNEELRKTAPIPEGKDDLTGMKYINKHNNIVMTIVSHWISDTGIVIWTSDAGDVYGSIEVGKHWDILGDEEE